MADHFFEPGAEYDDATGYSAPEIIRTFRCVAVAPLPDTGEPVAFGFMRTVSLGWGATVMGLGHWRRGWNRTSPELECAPSDGLKALAEANERERERQAAMSPEELEEYRRVQAEQMAFQDPDALSLGNGRPEPDTLPELVARLREYGLTQAADFFASVGLLVAREGGAGTEPRP